jgi:hypothetical protein
MLWVYTLLTQILNIPVMVFEMTFMSELKAKVAKIKAHKFTWFSSRQLKLISVLSVISAAVVVGLSLIITEFTELSILAVAFTIILSNYLSALSMLNNERLFWYLSNPKKFRNLEFQALVLGHVFSIPLLLTLGCVALVKVPNIISIIFKIRNSKKWLPT